MVSSPGGLALGLWCFSCYAGCMQALDQRHIVPWCLKGGKQWDVGTQMSRGGSFGLFLHLLLVSPFGKRR